jgi:hypothetical protein
MSVKKTRRFIILTEALASALVLLIYSLSNRLDAPSELRNNLCWYGFISVNFAAYMIKQLGARLTKTPSTNHLLHSEDHTSTNLNTRS